ncbi:hypothetical protein [Algoriphagus hitonicola]|uniref:Uncharacterized protein n=1 Tax=Algoriphagus hitonicola TaxID=435880 RepID=A0A1I2NID4_9BACT|nr:hypothetical protein [Algoriphagus hitonicola]SFG03373.1 hypothetical protein SAMN04487988_101136 [Algoriphagus hitonicola]
METILIKPKNEEEATTIKAILEALKVNFSMSETDEESIKIAKSVAQGYKELKEVKKGKLQAKDIDELLSEL